MSETSTILTVTDTYRIRKIPFNYSIEKWIPSREIKSGKYIGKISEAKWVSLEVYHGNLKDSLLAIRRLLIEDELAQYDEMLLDEAISIIESVDKLLINSLYRFDIKV